MSKKQDSSSSKTSALPQPLIAPLDPLTQREMDVLRLLAEGLSNQDIASALFITAGTVKWYNKQIFSKLNATNRTQAVMIARELGLFASAPAPSGLLPVPATPFIGRSQELNTIDQLMRDPVIRLITIQGIGGIGKTRLAVEAGSRSKPLFADGVWFVDLAPVRDAAQMPFSIANVLTVTLADGNDRWQLLADALGDKSLLLLLDNFESVLDGKSGISRLLDQAPGVKIMVTSRERLNLRVETAVTLGGLATGADNKDAHALFSQAVRQQIPDFQPDEDELSTIEAICQLVDNMPLALELAAALSAVLTLTDIHNEISRNLDLLSSEMGDLPPRHRSIRAVFNQSWELLAPEEQKVLSQISVFRGGFGLKTARQIANASIEMLATFVRKSLINLSPSGLYHFHDVLRQYAEEKLIHIPVTSLSTRTGILLAWSTFIRGDFERAEELVAEIFTPNTPADTDLDKMAFGLVLSGALAGAANAYDECVRLCEAGLVIAEDQPAVDPITLIFGYFGLAIAHCGLGQYTVSKASIQEALKHARQLKTPSFSLIFLPVAAFIKAQQTAFAEATRMLSFARAHPAGLPSWLAEWSLLVHLEQNLHAQLGQRQYETHWNAGRSLEMKQIVSELIVWVG